MKTIDDNQFKKEFIKLLKKYGFEQILFISQKGEDGHVLVMDVNKEDYDECAIAQMVQQAIEQAPELKELFAHTAKHKLQDMAEVQDIKKRSRHHES